MRRVGALIRRGRPLSSGSALKSSTARTPTPTATTSLPPTAAASLNAHDVLRRRLEGKNPMSVTTQRATTCSSGFRCRSISMGQQLHYHPCLLDRSRVLFFTTTTTTDGDGDGDSFNNINNNSSSTDQTSSNEEILHRAIRLAQLELPHESQILFDVLMNELKSQQQQQKQQQQQQQQQNNTKGDDHGSEDKVTTVMSMDVNQRDLSRLQTVLMDAWIKYQAKLVKMIISRSQRESLDTKAMTGGGGEEEVDDDEDDDIDDDLDSDIHSLKEIHHAANCMTKVWETTNNTSSMTTSSSQSHVMLAVLKAWANVCESSHHLHTTATIMPSGRKSAGSGSPINNNKSTMKRRQAKNIESIVGGIPQRMQHLLHRLEQQQKQQAHSTATVTVEMHNEILKAWAYSFEYLRGTMAEQTFQQIPYPNLQSYRYMILAYAWSYESRSAFNATGYFMRFMRRLEREAPVVSPRRYYYDPDDDDTKNSNNDNNNTMANDILSLDDYHVLVDAWTKAGDKHAPSKVYTVLEIMNDAYRNGLTSVRPDLTCYRDALVTVSRRQQLPEVGELADALLNDLQKPENQHSRSFMHPDTECYRSAILSWKHAAMARDTPNPEQAIQRCYDVLREMREAYYRTMQVTVRPTTQDFNNVLHALSLSSKHGVHVLRQGQVLFQALQNEMATTGGPDADSYKYLLTIIRKSSSNEKLDLASNLIQTLQENVDPVKCLWSDESLVDVFNAYLRVCASIGSHNIHGKTNKLTHDCNQSETSLSQAEQDKAVTLALRCVEEILKTYGLTPNPGTYAALVEVVDRLLPVDGPRRSRVLEQVFRRACNEGCVDQLLLERLKLAASTYQYADLVISQSVEMDNVKVVPAHWTRNVRGFKEGKKVMPLSIHGSFHFSKEAAEYRMRNLRRRSNQALLRGGRIR